MTAVSVVLPDVTIWKLLTAASMIAGLLLLASSVVLELRENRQARFALLGDFAEFPELHGFDEPRTNPDEVRDAKARADRRGPSSAI